MPDIKSFDEACRQQGVLNRLPPRYLPVKTRRIVGSVDEAKIAGLNKDFLPRDAGPTSSRFRSVYQAMQSDISLPPIEVYALRGEYYVVDGHHRVAAARTLGFLYLDALVHEFLLPATSDENRLYNQQLHFERISGLTGIVLTETGQYRKLLNQIREHGYFLAQNGKPASFKAAAADWHEYVYGPITERLAADGMLSHFPGRTVGDLYVYVCDHKWVKSQNRGMDIGFPKALADFERLFPPQMSGAGGMLTTPLHALRSLAAPVVIVGRFALGRSHAFDDDLTSGAAATQAKERLCPICGGPLEDGATTICLTCRGEVGAVS